MNPENMKWRIKSFPWFDNIQAIQGDTLTAGTFSTYGGIANLDIEELLEAANIDLNNSDNDDDDKSTSKLPAINNQLSQTTTVSTATVNAMTDTSDNNDTQKMAARETKAAKRHRLSQQSMLPRKTKMLGIGVMDMLAKGISSMAEAIGWDRTMTPETPKESPNATIQGQTQQKIQDEDCLTLEGQLLMLELLTDVTLTQTFLIIKKTSYNCSGLDRILSIISPPKEWRRLSLTASGNLWKRKHLA